MQLYVVALEGSKLHAVVWILTTSLYTCSRSIVLERNNRESSVWGLCVATCIESAIGGKQWPCDGCIGIGIALATCALYYWKYHLNITIVATVVANDYVNRLSCAGNGVANGLTAGIVGLAVNRGRREFVISLDADGSTLARRNSPLGILIELCPVGPVAVGELTTIVGVEVCLYVDDLVTNGGLSNPNASSILVCYGRSTLIAAESIVERYFGSTVGQ